MKRRLAVILMADMVDYSRLMEADQAGTIGLVQALREKWLEPEAVTRGGVMISEDLHRQLDAKLAEGFSDAGTFELKNISRPVTGFQWRPSARAAASVDDVPVIAVEPIAAVPGRQDVCEAAADLQEQLALRLSRRTGIRVLSLDAEGEGTPTYLVRGRLRVGGSTAKLTLSLTLRESGRVLWSDVYEGAGDDLFDLVDRATDLAENALRLEINAFDGERIAELPDDALNASELRTRAAHCFYTTQIAGYQRACELLDRSLRLAPGNAMSLAMWAHAQTWLLLARFDKGGPEHISEIAARADAAVQAAPRSDFVGKVRAEVRLKLLDDIEGAKRAIVRVAQLNPNYALLKMVEAEVALAEGDWSRVSEIVTEYVEQNSRDPDLPYMLYVGAVAEMLDGRFDKARRGIAEAIERRPTSRPYWLLLIEIHRRSSNAAAEEKARREAADLAGEPDILAPVLALPKADQALMATLAPSAG